jgi:hypothetical protein
MRVASAATALPAPPAARSTPRRSRERPVGEQAQSNGGSYAEHDAPDHQLIVVADGLRHKTPRRRRVEGEAMAAGRKTAGFSVGGIIVIAGILAIMF